MKKAHELSVIIGGAISQGFRANLFRCPEHANGRTYMEMIANDAVFYQCIRQFGEGWFLAAERQCTNTWPRQ
jgi:hypothetical protein